MSLSLGAAELSKNLEVGCENGGSKIETAHTVLTEAAPLALLERLHSTVSDDASEFLTTLATKIESEWYPPKCGGDKALQITFKILRDGSIDSIEFLKSSGDKYVDAAAQEAILNVNGALPLPDQKVDFEEFCLHVNILVQSAESNLVKIKGQE